MSGVNKAFNLLTYVNIAKAAMPTLDLCGNNVGNTIFQYRICIGHDNIANAAKPILDLCGTNVGSTRFQYRICIDMPTLPNLPCQLRSNVVPMLEVQYSNIGFALPGKYCQCFQANSCKLCILYFEQVNQLMRTVTDDPVGQNR